MQIGEIKTKTSRLERIKKNVFIHRQHDLLYRKSDRIDKKATIINN